MIVTNLRDTTGSIPDNILQRSSALAATQSASQQNMQSEADQLNTAFDTLVGQSQQPVAQLMAGQIPADVQAQVRQLAAQNSMSRGLFGQSARALVARDLGLTSMQLQQTGLTAANALAQTAGTRANQLQNNSLTLGGLQDTQARTDIAAAQLRDESRRANVNAALSGAQLMGQTLQDMHQIAYGYATAENANEEQATDLGNDFSKFITSLRSLLGTG